MNLTATQGIDFARRFELIIGALAVLVAARFRTLGVPHTLLLWGRLKRAIGRINRLIARLAAGRLRPSRSDSRPRPPALPRPPTLPRPPDLPRTRIWLVRELGYMAAGYGSQLEALLNDPETAALLAAAPSAGRTLRPLCRMLGVALPAFLQLPPRPPRPRPVRPVRPATPPTPPRSRVHPWGIPRSIILPYRTRRAKSD